MDMSQIEKIKTESENLKKEVKEKTTGYIIAGLGLVVGLAWNDAIKDLIEYLFPLSTNTLWAKFFYAFVITLVLVVAAYYVSKLSGREKK